jgi:hypothetical protein
MSKCLEVNAQRVVRIYRSTYVGNEFRGRKYPENECLTNQNLGTRSQEKDCLIEEKRRFGHYQIIEVQMKSIKDYPLT